MANSTLSAHAAILGLILAGVYMDSDVEPFVIRPLPPTWRNYVTAQLLKDKPIYNWYIFPHSFSKELVNSLTQRFDISPGDMVLDIFVGAGTTVLACKQAGINAHGFDVLPFSTMVTKTKVASYDADVLYSFWKNVSATESKSVAIPDIPLLQRAFTRCVYRRLAGILDELNSAVPDPLYRRFFHLALLNILEDVSFAKKSGGWLSIVDGTELNEAEVTAKFRTQVEKMIEDVDNSSSQPSPKGKWDATIQDARSLDNTKIVADAVITSPPYLNRHDYTRIFALELTTGFITSQQELKHLRYGSLRSHPEARASKGADVSEFQRPAKLQEVLGLLPTDRRGCDTRVKNMIDGYFEDMFLVLRSVKRRVRSGGHIAFVIGNVQFGGITIPVDEIVASIGESIGLKCIDVLVARERGNSAQQMRDFGKKESRESIVIWRH